MCVVLKIALRYMYNLFYAALVPFTAATLVVLLCPLSLVWLKLAARYWKPSKAVSKQSSPPPLDGGSRGPPKQKSRTAVLVLCSSEKRSSPRCKVVKTVVCVLVILGVLFLLLLLAGDVERNPGPTSESRAVWLVCVIHSSPPSLSCDSGKSG